MINDRLQKIIKKVLVDRKDKHGWKSGLFSNILRLSVDERGEVGERLLEELLSKAGIKGVTRGGQLDRTKKHWDIRTVDMDIEVKTATLGRNTTRFQHESIEKDRDYHAICMIDIAPSEIYVTWCSKKLMPFKSCMHRRANSNAYKWDLNLNDLRGNQVKTLDDIVKGYNAVKAAIKSER